MMLWAVIPAKDPARAKSRLAHVFTPAQRRALSLGLLERTLQVLRQVPTEMRCAVISSAHEPLALAQHHGAQALHEAAQFQRESSGGWLLHRASADEPALNAALRQATVVAAGQGAEALLVLPADLPRLTPAAIIGLIGSLPPGPGVVLAPDRQYSGTNALLVRPALATPFHFGARSFDRHREAAARQGLAVTVYDHPALALDLDTPDDVEELTGLPAPLPSGEYDGAAADQLLRAVLCAGDAAISSGHCA